ncbi:MAG: quinoprotein dehydrogenase-associated SoxYZ-like carrier [Betaproteobacteria bacterium]
MGPASDARAAGAPLKWLLLVLWWVSPMAWAADVPDPDASAVWQKIRASLFAGKAITQSQGAQLRLELPARAEDAATVPVAIHSNLPLNGQISVEKIYLIVDDNPSPIAAVFSLHPLAGRVDLETRIRVETYTHVRALALMSDGSALMTVKYIKAAGGCSAPAGREAEAANIGKMRLSLPQGLQAGRATQVQLMVNHPNESGLAMDQLTRLYPPAYYVRSLEVRYQGAPVLSAELDFAISQNPHFRFYLLAAGDGPLEVTVTDTQDRVFKSAATLAALDRPQPRQ